MYVEDIDGLISKWSINGREINTDTRSKSALHLRARHLLKKVFSTVQILEEISFKVKKNKTLYFDFYIPILQYAVEVNGEQHYKFVPRFHGTAQGFLQAKKNDAEKKQWCALNNILLTILPFNQSDIEWENSLNG